MANENKDISEIVKKCKILLLDIEGTTTSISFVKDKLFPYAEENVKQFLEKQWETDDVKGAVEALRKLAIEDQEKKIDGAVTIPGEDASKEDQIEGLVNNVKWQMSSDRKAGALKQLQGLIWKQGYDSGDIKGHVFDDVSAALEQWRSVEEQKVYIYSSGSVQAQKLLFGQSLAGNLLRFIDGHFDTAVGAKQEAASYTAIAEKIGVKPDEVLFLTDIDKEAEAARTAGMHVALVSREGNAPLSTEATAAFAVLHSLAQLTVTNKRKTEPQVEQPTKIPKTDTDDDVKTTTDSVVSKNTEDVQDKMEVEEAPVIPEPAEEKQKVEETKVETVIEDITDSVDPIDVPMMDVDPVITEVENEKKNTDQKTDTTQKLITKDHVVEGATKPNEEVKSDEILTKTDIDATKTDEVVTKPNEVTNKTAEDVNKPKEVIAKPDDVDTKTAELEKPTEVSPPIECKEPEAEAKVNENKSKKDNENENLKISEDQAQDKVDNREVKEKVTGAEETPRVVITDIEEITGDNLGDVAEMIENLEPVVEEPTSEEMEDLQNVGEVLEKECDEILSKVQDVTNLDSIPLKPLLNPIAEETMETEIDAENMDSNDIVERILDTELELEMKQCNDIDINTVTELSNDKTEQSAGTNITEENKVDSEINTKTEESITQNEKEQSKEPEITLKDNSNLEKPADKVDANPDKMETSDKVENNDRVKNCDEIESNNKVENNEMETDTKVENQEEIANENKSDNIEKESSNKIESKEVTDDANKEVLTDKMETNKEDSSISKDEESKDKPSDNGNDEIKSAEDLPVEAKTETEKDAESQLNGKATNGDAETVNVNGDASKVEELNARLSVENGNKTVNGSNGDSVDSEKGQGDKAEAEVSDIKVKTVATEEPHGDPIEQPTEA